MRPPRRCGRHRSRSAACSPACATETGRARVAWNQHVTGSSLLFVYGTLRKGGGNDIGRLAPQARFVSIATMRGRMFDLGDYPTVLLDTAAGDIVGELYDVTTRDWIVLDALEEIVTPTRPDGEYFRVAGTATDPHGRVHACQVYVANADAVRLDRPVAGGDWLAHRLVRTDSR